MNFNKETICNLSKDESGLSQYEKEYLRKKYFPEQVPEWKQSLRREKERDRYTKRCNAYMGTGTYDIDGEGQPFRWSHDTLMKVGRRYDQENVGNRVTDFTNWIMRLYLGTPRESAFRLGKRVERSIARRSNRFRSNRFRSNRFKDPHLELIYRDPLDEKPTPLKISTLVVNGECIWGAPDLVYRNRESGEIIIVERKASYAPIPSDGWPNLKAQLWAYSQIEEFSKAESIILIGEVWGSYNGRPRLRKIHRWVHTDPVFNESADLFKLYGGTIRA